MNLGKESEIPFCVATRGRDTTTSDYKMVTPYFYEAPMLPDKYSLVFPPFQGHLFHSYHMRPRMFHKSKHAIN